MTAISRLATSALLLVVLPFTASAATEVNTCGQTFDDGFLAADLDCTGLDENVYPNQGGRLDLAGFTLTANVPCQETCEIFSSAPGGTIAGHFVSALNLTLEDLLIEGGQDTAVSARNLKATRVVIRDWTAAAADHPVVQAYTSMTLVDSTLENNSPGRYLLNAGCSFCDERRGKIKLLGCSITGNSPVEVGAAALINAKSGARIQDSVIEGNTALYAVYTPLPGRVLLKRSRVNGNSRIGISAPRVKLIDSEVSENGLSGVWFAHRVSLRGSETILNGTDPACGTPGVCSDLETSAAPRLDAESTCDTSHVTDSGFPGSNWGVCSLD